MENNDSPITITVRFVDFLFPIVTGGVLVHESLRSSNLEKELFLVAWKIF